MEKVNFPFDIETFFKRCVTDKNIPKMALEVVCNPVMDLKNVSLLEVSLVAYEKMERFWAKKRHKTEKLCYAKILNPIEGTDYEQLMLELTHMPHAYLLKVIQPGGRYWHKCHVPRLLAEPELIKQFAKEASSDRMKRNYFEVDFKKDPANLCHNYRLEFGHLVTLGFREYQCRIIGYEMYIPGRLRHLVGAPEFSNDCMAGLWVPEDKSS